LKEKNALEKFTEGSEGEDGLESALRKPKRECQVPKPGGIVGEMFGFRTNSAASSISSNDGKGSRPP
jgi:hypothetical protein